jgi:acetyl-CoA acetyltransferase
MQERGCLSHRDTARMALLLAGFPVGVGGTTINRLCGSGLDAVANAVRALMLGEVHVYTGDLQQLNDSAAAVLLVLIDYACAHGLKHLAKT